MKLFWALVGLLALVGVGLLVAGGGGGGGGGAGAGVGVEGGDGDGGGVGVVIAEAGGAAGESGEAARGLGAGAVGVAEAEVGVEAEVGLDAGVEAGVLVIDPKSPEVAALVRVIGGLDAAAVRGLWAAGAWATRAIAEAKPGAGGEAEGAAGAEGARAAIDEVRRLEDGRMVIGGQWEVKGRGTAEEPYVLSWEMLQSVAGLYNPRLSREALPAWASELNGKRVAMKGYTLLPVGGVAQDQLLVMKNEWDGCCIGTPPTPYDAAEVILSGPIGGGGDGGGGDGFIGSSPLTYGTVTGTFKLEPYVVRGWLLGLYLVEDASFVPGV